MSLSVDCNCLLSKAKRKSSSICFYQKFSGTEFDGVGRHLFGLSPYIIGFLCEITKPHSHSENLVFFLKKKKVNTP